MNSYGSVDGSYFESFLQKKDMNWLNCLRIIYILFSDERYSMGKNEQVEFQVCISSGFFMWQDFTDHCY
jgi:hypothetical protein